MKESASLLQTESPDATSWLENIVSDPGNPVVLFSSRWCGYCWAARDILQRHAVTFREIDTQSSDDMDGLVPAEVRRALRDRTGSPTVPQIFIGSESLGGATELVAALHSGNLETRLTTLGIDFCRPD